MKQDKKLILGMSLLFLITFVFFGTLIVTEKLAPLYTNKVKEKFIAYLTKNYKNNSEFTLKNVTYTPQKYEAKVTNKKNKDLYFTITYKNKKITDTYKKDYLEGKTLLNKLEKALEKDIKDHLNQEVKVTFPLTLNKYTKIVQEDLLNNNSKKTNMYDISLTITSIINQTEITNKITTLNNELKSLNIIPNHYTITIKSKNNNDKLTIKNLTQKTIEKNILFQITSDIITNKESNLLKNNNVTFEYINKGE